MSRNDAETLIEGSVQRSRRALCARHRARCCGHLPDGRDARRSGQRQVRSRTEHARAGRDRVRRHLHRRQERRHGHVRAGAAAKRCSKASAWPTSASSTSSSAHRRRANIAFARATSTSSRRPARRSSSPVAAPASTPGRVFPRVPTRWSSARRTATSPDAVAPDQMYLASPLTVAASAVAGYIVEYEPAGQRETASLRA